MPPNRLLPLLCALLLAGCCSTVEPPAKAPSVPTTSPAPAPKSPAPRKGQPLPPGTLSTTLAKAGLTAKPLAYEEGKAAQWAVLPDRRGDTDAPLRHLKIARQTARGFAPLAIDAFRVVPGPLEERPVFDEDAVDLKLEDLDGDGLEEALLTVTLARQTDLLRDQEQPACEGGGCFLNSLETVEQLLVLGGAAGAPPRVLLSHALSYAVRYDAAEAIDTTPPPEEIRYGYAAQPAPAAQIVLQRTKHDVAAGERPPTLLKPGKHPLFAAGAARAFPLRQ